MSPRGGPGRVGGRGDSGDRGRSVGRGGAGRVGARDDRGVATVYACVGVVMLLVAVGFAARLGAAVLARQRAEIGADLAALAGAVKVLQGPDMACAAALKVAVANGAELADCTVRGADVLVTVEASVGSGPFAAAAAGRARAGPVLPVDDPGG